MTGTWYRLQDASRPAETLLDPATWRSGAWEPVYRRCDPCGGTGSISTADDGDPYAADTCPDCRGSAEVEDVRMGVSVCADLDALVAYFSTRGCDYSHEYVDNLVVVALAGQLSGDDDHDEAYGAWLIYPTSVVSVQRVPDQLRAVITGGV